MSHNIMAKNITKTCLISLSAITAIALSHVPEVMAGQHGANCLNNATQEISDCRINIDLNAKTIDIKFKDENQQNGNLSLAGNEIDEISTGTYAKTQVEKIAVSAITGGPISAIVNALDPQKRRQYALTYGSNEIFLIDIPQQYSLLLQQELQSISGLSVQAQPPNE
ncbi:MAG: hypothetical protein ACRC2J_16865 [Microcoleaceae cyanobacterium]